MLQWLNKATLFLHCSKSNSDYLPLLKDTSKYPCTLKKSILPIFIPVISLHKLKTLQLLVSCELKDLKTRSWTKKCVLCEGPIRRALHVKKCGALPFLSNPFCGWRYIYIPPTDTSGQRRTFNYLRHILTHTNANHDTHRQTLPYKQAQPHPSAES